MRDVGLQHRIVQRPEGFSKDKVAAVNDIDSLEPPGVYEKLRTGPPCEETRQYLVRVVGYRKQFLSFGKAD